MDRAGALLGCAAGAVQAGDRAPDGLVQTADGAALRLFDVFRGPRFTLLGFGHPGVTDPFERRYPPRSGPAPSRAPELAGIQPSGEPVHAQCATAVHRAGRLLESLVHRVEPGFPPALGDPSHRAALRVLRTTNMGASNARLADTLGREITPDDVEPVNWEQARQARTLTAVDHARAQAGAARFRRAVH